MLPIGSNTWAFFYGGAKAIAASQITDISDRRGGVMVGHGVDALCSSHVPQRAVEVVVPSKFYAPSQATVRCT